MNRSILAKKIEKLLIIIVEFPGPLVFKTCFSLGHYIGHHLPFDKLWSDAISIKYDVLVAHFSYSSANYTVLHTFMQVLFLAGNPSNHKN